MRRSPLASNSEKLSLSRLKLHSFCSATGEYHYLACILSAASAAGWWAKDILGGDFSFEGSVKPGENEVFFLPYLMGERSPLNDAGARALLYGMSMSTTRQDITLAVFEGVAFALRQNLDLIRERGVKTTAARICGGGVKNREWLKIIAAVLGIRLDIPAIQDSAALGAALLTARGVLNSGEYETFAAAFYRSDESIYPDSELQKKYNENYQKFLHLYPAVKNL